MSFLMFCAAWILDKSSVITVMKGGVKQPHSNQDSNQGPGGSPGSPGGHTHGRGRPRPLWISDRGTSFEVTTPIFGRGRPRPLFGSDTDHPPTHPQVTHSFPSSQAKSQGG